MLWRLPNKEIKSYIRKTRNDQGLKLSDSYLLGNKLETKKIDPGEGGGKRHQIYYGTSRPNYGQIVFADMDGVQFLISIFKFESCGKVS